MSQNPGPDPGEVGVKLDRQSHDFLHELKFSKIVLKSVSECPIVPKSYYDARDHSFPCP